MSLLSGLFGGGGGAGSGGGVKSPTTTTTTETRAATGQSYADRGSQSISGIQLQDTASVTLSDQGAIGRAFDFTADLVKNALGASSEANKQAVAAYQNVQDRTGGVDADSAVKLGLVGLLLLGGVIAFMGSRK